MTISDSQTISQTIRLDIGVGPKKNIHWSSLLFIHDLVIAFGVQNLTHPTCNNVDSSWLISLIETWNSPMGMKPTPSYCKFILTYPQTSKTSRNKHSCTPFGIENHPSKSWLPSWDSEKHIPFFLAINWMKSHKSGQIWGLSPALDVLTSPVGQWPKLRLIVIIETFCPACWGTG